MLLRISSAKLQPFMAVVCKARPNHYNNKEWNRLSVNVYDFFKFYDKMWVRKFLMQRRGLCVTRPLWVNGYSRSVDNNTIHLEKADPFIYMMTSSMESFSALLAICAGNSPVPGEFPTQRPVTRSFGVFFDLRLNKQLSKPSWGWWFETLSRPFWRHRYDLDITGTWELRNNINTFNPTVLVQGVLFSFEL